MNIWKRTALYLSRNKGKCFLLLLILTVISSAFIICLSVWTGSQKSIRRLRQTYGTAFVIEPDFEVEEVKPLTDEDIDKVMSIRGIVDVCKEIKTTLFFDEIELTSGLYSYGMELEKNIRIRQMKIFRFRQN